MIHVRIVMFVFSGGQFYSVLRTSAAQHPKYLSKVLNNTQNRHGMHHLDEEACRLVRLLRTATVSHHVTPLATWRVLCESALRVAEQPGT